MVEDSLDEETAAIVVYPIRREVQVLQTKCFEFVIEDCFKSAHIIPIQLIIRQFQGEQGLVHA